MRAHTFPRQIEPEVIIGFCEKPTRVVMLFHDKETHVESYCEEGHLIKGKIYSSFERASEIADRLRHWVEISLESK